MPIVFRQFFEPTSSTFTYLLADTLSREAMIIDPVLETFDRDLQFIQELNLELKLILETHIHADHITASGKLRQKTQAQILAGAATGLPTADRLLDDGEDFRLGSLSFITIATPGHTDGCTSYFGAGMVFTGDTLLIRGCGRTDFQQGSNQKLFHSVREKLFRLPDTTLVYPAHDYKGRTCSSIGEEKEFNPRLKLSLNFAQFEAIMNGLDLPPPEKIKEAVPANLKSGL